ncbi:DsbA family protein [Lacticaseibacillus daqingensis]|uniref:DsbA family protein n=1 Tax=Lacticaseibacillus daqingensis TaxID=2486014 RepID=UPI000F7B537E|nr:DsbA family protein [Lacticaseibacillus daqingensis]
MLELFLFVNPISRRCRQAEAAVYRLVSELQSKITVHFIPVVNFQVIDQYMQDAALDHQNLATRNQLFETAYQLSLDYKAAQFQGNKKARALLMAEQEMLDTTPHHYDAGFAARCLTALGLDREAFNADRAREAMHRCLTSDQGIAHEMGVTAVPSAVLIDNAHPDAPAVRLEHLSSYQMFKTVCVRLLTNPAYGRQQRQRVR